MDKASTQAVLRKCVACGYDLTGLGVQPRCPECGLLNIPGHLRQQVWDLIDRRPWFVSSFHGLWARRLPGWWWALDRRRDLARSFRFAAAHAAISLVLISSAGLVADAIQVEEKTRYFWIDPRDPSVRLPAREWTSVHGVMWSLRSVEETVSDYGVPSQTAGMRTTLTTSWRVKFGLSLRGVPLIVGLYAWVVLVWAVPAMVGIWTQIRPGLPPYAKPPRTIITACNYESHRMTYVAVTIAVALMLDVVMRMQGWPAQAPVGYASLVAGLGAAAAVFGACGWIGPLRSDYTRQLIRSPLHAARILVMYAVVFPLILAPIIAAAAAELLSLPY